MVGGAGPEKKLFWIRENEAHQQHPPEGWARAEGSAQRLLGRAGLSETGEGLKRQRKKQEALPTSPTGRPPPV